jgi:hypothetical protein
MRGRGKAAISTAAPGRGRPGPRGVAIIVLLLATSVGIGAPASASAGNGAVSPAALPAGAASHRALSAAIEPPEPANPLAGNWYTGSGGLDAWSFIADNSGVVTATAILPVFYSQLCTLPVGSHTYQYLTPQPNGEYQGYVLGHNPLTCAEGYPLIGGVAMREFSNGRGDAMLEIVEPMPGAPVGQPTINADGSVVSTAPSFCLALGRTPAGPSFLPGDFCNRLDREWPSDGLGYSFVNRGMADYTDSAGLRPASVLRPSSLSLTFQDWNYMPLVTGALGGVAQEEVEVLTGAGVLGHFWEQMRLGTCYGLALSGGRFAAGAEALYAPASGRSDASWNVGSGQSASVKLPAPEGSSSASYIEQFLQLDTNDFLTQNAAEVQSSLEAQEKAFAVAPKGFARLREQVETILGYGVGLYGNLSGPTGYALILLKTRAGPGYAHALMAYGVEGLAGEVLKIDVWDNSYPGVPSYLLVNPDGTWSYSRAPFPNGTAFSFQGGAGGATGGLFALPLYRPVGLHLYPAPRAAIVNVAPDATATNPLAGDGSTPSSQLTVSSSTGYNGESLSYASDDGSLDLSGDDPGIEVRGANVYMSLDAAGPVHVEEDTGAGSVSGTGAPVSLTVARGDVLISSSGASSLAVDQAGAARATADASGTTQVVLKFNDHGSLGSRTLFSGATGPGQVLTFSRQEILRAELGEPGAAPAARKNVRRTRPPRPRHKARKLRCKKGFVKKRKHGKVRCVKRKHRAHRHHHGPPAAGQHSK